MIQKKIKNFKNEYARLFKKHLEKSKADPYTYDTFEKDVEKEKKLINDEKN